MSQPAANLEVAIKLGIKEDEYHLINQKLGREANFTELCIFSVMWSEHCSYKNSIKWLKTLPRDGAKMLVKAGEENAGVVDLGNGLGCVFKIESHNHPSAIEPYQGAATGVGGIHRDIFTMGARPIAALNSLRFGRLDNDKTKHLLKGVVKGIGDYGNCFGVPTVGGEVFFDEVYQTNPLVNAMSVGLIDVNKIISAMAAGVGNPVFIVGSSTGKDGIGGASFASKDISEDSANDLPAVQVGDPFQEKLLLEASLELAETGAIVGMQDMGAAGITCSTSEMSAKGGIGMNVWLDKVPTRQANMQPFEILLSESQERMLIVVEKGREAEVMAIFDKWDLNCVQIGEIIEEEMLYYYANGELVAKIPPHELVLGGGAPVYDRAYSEPAYYSAFKKFDITSIAEPTNYVQVAKQLMGLPNIASKRAVYTQYDSMVGVNTATTNTPSDAAVVRVKGSNRGIACTVDCNARYVSADPKVGAMIAVSEAARNIVCSGGVPSAITNCLNFGNPYNPEVYWQFVQAINGMGEACRKFDTPVTGGNVSFYNQSEDGPVFPTPTIGMVGVINDMKHFTSLSFRKAADILILIGDTKNDISSSEYLVNICGQRESSAPHFDIDEEFKLQESIKALIQQGAIQSAHDVSEGGIFACLVESGIQNQIGFSIEGNISVRKDAFLFGENQSRVIVSVSSEKLATVESSLKGMNQVYSILGITTNGPIQVFNEDFGSIADYVNIYNNSISDTLYA